jgi:hypothetical protein
MEAIRIGSPLERIAIWQLKRVLRHRPAYLVWREKSYSNLLKSLDRFPEVRVRIGLSIHISGHFHPLRWTIHFVESPMKTARSKEENAMGLLSRNEERVRL